MQSNRPKRAFVKKRDLIFLAVLLAAAGLLFLFFWSRVKAPAATAVVTVGLGEAQTTQRISLAENGLHSIEGGRLPVLLLVEDGGIRFVDSVCPDHLCEGFGILRGEGDWAACLPAEVTVQIEPEN